MLQHDRELAAIAHEGFLHEQPLTDVAGDDGRAGDFIHDQPLPGRRVRLTSELLDEVVPHAAEEHADLAAPVHPVDRHAVEYQREHRRAVLGRAAWRASIRRSSPTSGRRTGHDLGGDGMATMTSWPLFYAELRGGRLIGR